MRSTTLLAVAVLAVICGTPPVAAGPIDQSALQIRGSLVIYQPTIAQSGKSIFFFTSTPSRELILQEIKFFEPATRETADLLAATLLLYSDPYIHYRLGLENLTDEPLRVAMDVRLPTMALSAPDFVASESLSIDLTDLNGDGATLTPALPHFVTALDGMLIPAGERIQESFAIIESGISTLGPSLTGGVSPDSVIDSAGGGSPTVTFNSGLLNFPSYDEFTANIPNFHSPFPPGVPWNSLVLQVSFDLSAHDRVFLTGGIDVLPAGSAVPVPGAAVMFAPALLGLLGWRRSI